MQFSWKGLEIASYFVKKQVSTVSSNSRKGSQKFVGDFEPVYLNCIIMR